MPENNRLQIAVVGSAEADAQLQATATECGALLAQAGAVLLCGGRGGVMAAAARGATLAGGRTIGILPGRDAQESPPNEAIQVAVFTGMGQARNLVLVQSAMAVLALPGGWGTLSEIALALKQGIPVVSLGSWEPCLPSGEKSPLLVSAHTPEDAVQKALKLARR